MELFEQLMPGTFQQLELSGQIILESLLIGIVLTIDFRDVRELELTEQLISGAVN